MGLFKCIASMECLSEHASYIVRTDNRRVDNLENRVRRNGGEVDRTAGKDIKSDEQ